MVVVALIRGIERNLLGLRLARGIQLEPVERAAGVGQQILAIGRPVRRFPKFVRSVDDANALALQIIDRNLAANVAGVLLCNCTIPRRGSLQMRFGMENHNRERKNKKVNRS